MTYRLRIISSIMAFFFISLLYAQKPFSKDSLKTVITNKKASDSLRINAYFNLVNSYMYENRDSTLYYADRLFRFARKKNSDNGLYFAHYSKAFYYYMEGSLDNTIMSLDSARYYAAKAGYFNGVVEANLKLGSIHTRANNIKKAEEHIQFAIENAKQNKLYGELAEGYFSLGNLNLYLKKYDESLENFLKCDSINNIEPVSNVTHGNAISNIGSIYRSLENHDKALFYYQKAREIFREIDYVHGIEITKLRIGQTYFRMGRYGKSQPLLEQAIEYYTQSQDRFMLLDAHTALGELLIKLGNHDKGIQNLEKALQYAEQNDDEFSMVQINIELGHAYLELRQFEKSKTAAEKALQVAEQNNLGIENALSLLADSNYGLNNYQEAYDNLLEYNRIVDSLDLLSDRNKLQEMEAKYQSDKKEQEIALLQSENELIEQKQKSERNLLIGGLAITTLAGVFLFVMFRNRQKTNTKLRELDQMKSNFFTNISHEFRTPLTLISNPIEEAIDDDSLDDRKRERFVVAKRSSDRLLALVNQVLDLSKIDAGQLKLHVQQGNVMPFISALASSFNYGAERKGIQYDVRVEPSEEQQFYDKDAIEKIVVNLLSNAIKFTPENGNVQFNAKIVEGRLHIEVRNSGSNLTKSEMQNIFERFYQTHENRSGSGIGLALVKELVDLHHGNIEAVSDQKDWISFKVELSVNRDSFRNEDIQSADAAERYVVPLTKEFKVEREEEQIQTDSDLPILLIVEDNLDIQNLIMTMFSVNYNVITANNGKEGVDEAIENVPDIIISDVMMPVKDGIELTKQLKHDERTSHIPIILLTAKAGDQNELLGIEVGADDYITKPFNSNILKAKVDKLIESRRLLQQRYSREIVLQPVDVVVNDAESKFFERIQNILNHKLSNADYHIEDFSNDMAMSRMQLHRKLKALTGLTTSEFIRTQRLKMATELIKTTQSNISEIVYAVGFNDASYFTKCFRETYGCSPSEYRNNR